MKKSIFKIALCSTLSLSAFAGAGNHHAAVFVGGTAVDSNNNFTLGVDYVYKTNYFDKKLSVGVLAEGFRTPGYDAYVAAIPFVYQYGDWKSVVAAGVEISHGSSYGLARIGGGYDFHVGSYSVSPVLNLDFVKAETAVNYGVTFGMSF